MRIIFVALLFLFYGCTQTSQDPPQRECYAAADGGVECYPA